MAGRTPFPNDPRYYPPFLAPDLGVDPFNPESVVFTFTEAENAVREQAISHQELESELVIPDGALGHVVVGRPIHPDFSTFVGYRPSHFISATGDVPFRGGVHGDIAYRGANGWVLLPASTVSGDILISQGGGSGPRWQAA